MYLPRTSSSPGQPVDCCSPNFPAELVVAAVSNWWQQFKSSAASTVSPTIADTAAVVMPCVGRGCCRYRLALLSVASPVLTVTSVLTQFNSLGIGQRVPCGEGANLCNIEQEVSNQPDSDMS